MATATAEQVRTNGSGGAPVAARQRIRPRKRWRNPPLKPLPGLPKRLFSRDGSAYPWDPIFFRKIDVKIGARLQYMGRLAPGTLWRVTEILSDKGSGRGDQRIRHVYQMNDLVKMVLDDEEGVRRYGRLERAGAFGYLSYSAVWRLPPPSAD